MHDRARGLDRNEAKVAEHLVGLPEAAFACAPQRFEKADESYTGAAFRRRYRRDMLASERIDERLKNSWNVKTLELFGLACPCFQLQQQPCAGGIEIA